MRSRLARMVVLLLARHIYSTTSICPVAMGAPSPAESRRMLLQGQQFPGRFLLPESG